MGAAHWVRSRHAPLILLCFPSCGDVPLGWPTVARSKCSDQLRASAVSGYQPSGLSARACVKDWESDWITTRELSARRPLDVSFRFRANTVDGSVWAEVSPPHLVSVAENERSFACVLYRC